MSGMIAVQWWNANRNVRGRNKMVMIDLPERPGHLPEM
jgi:hypothetical protein